VEVQQFHDRGDPSEVLIKLTERSVYSAAGATVNGARSADLQIAPVSGRGHGGRECPIGG
jgi:hypothetical protein